MKAQIEEARLLICPFMQKSCQGPFCAIFINESGKCAIKLLAQDFHFLTSPEFIDQALSGGF